MSAIAAAAATVAALEAVLSSPIIIDSSLFSVPASSVVAVVKRRDTHIFRRKNWSATKAAAQIVCTNDGCRVYGHFETRLPTSESVHQDSSREDGDSHCRQRCEDRRCFFSQPDSSSIAASTASPMTHSKRGQVRSVRCSHYTTSYQRATTTVPTKASRRWSKSGNSYAISVCPFCLIITPPDTEQNIHSFTQRETGTGGRLHRFRGIRNVCALEKPPLMHGGSGGGRSWWLPKSQSICHHNNNYYHIHIFFLETMRCFNRCIDKPAVTIVS